MTDAAVPERARQRLRIGSVWVDVLTFQETLREIERLVDRKQGGSVFTPNVDHVVKASMNTPFREAYDRVSLSVADGMPLIWASPLLGCPLPEAVLRDRGDRGRVHHSSRGRGAWATVDGAQPGRDGRVSSER